MLFFRIALQTIYLVMDFLERADRSTILLGIACFYVRREHRLQVVFGGLFTQQLGKRMWIYIDTLYLL